MEDEVISWIGVFGFAIAILALFFVFVVPPEYTFNETQFSTNDTNISINDSWIVDLINNSGDLSINTNHSLTSGSADFWDLLDTPADIPHNWLDATSLLWSNAGHTIDTDLDTNNNQIKEVALATEDYDAVPYVQINQTILDLTASTTYYPTSFLTVYGTESGGNNIGNLSFDNSGTFNITEANGLNALEFYVNFTGVDKVPDFITLGEQYDGTHYLLLQVWDYDESSWETYQTISGQSTIFKGDVALVDGSSHVENELVQLRFIHPENGVATHKLIIDFINLVSGFSTITTSEHDGLSGRGDILMNHPNSDDVFLLLNGSNANSNVNIGDYNMTANYFIGDGSKLTGISAGGTSNWNISGDYLIPANSSHKLKMISAPANLPNITGSVSQVLIEDPEACDVFDTIVVKVWGYKDFQEVRQYTKNFLTDTAIGDGDVEELSTVSYTVSNSGEYDGYLIYLEDTEQSYSYYFYDSVLPNPFNYTDCIFGQAPYSGQQTDDRPTTTSGGYEEDYMAEFSGIAGENGTENLPIATNAVALKNWTVLGHTILDSAYISSLIVGAFSATSITIGSVTISGSTISIGGRTITHDGTSFKFKSGMATDLLVYDDKIEVRDSNGATGIIWDADRTNQLSVVRDTNTYFGDAVTLASAEKFNVKGNQWMVQDNDKIYFGAGKSSSIYESASAFNIDSGNGIVQFGGGTDNINVSTVYYDTLTAKSPIFQCSDDWCSVGFPEKQKTLWIQKDENYTVLDIVWEDTHYTKQQFWQLVQGTQYENIALKLNEKISRLSEKEVCENSGHFWDGECYDLIIQSATYAEAVESYEVNIIERINSTCTELNSQLQPYTFDCEKEVATGQTETKYKFKEGCQWELNTGYTCQVRMIV